MTREEFIKVLEEEGYSYEIDGDKIVINHRMGVDLRGLKTLPPGTEFKNGGYVCLDSLETLPPGVVFRNEGKVYLESLKTLPPGVEFRNEGSVYLHSLVTLPPGVMFRNGGDVNLESLIGGVFINKWIGNWIGNIEGVDSKRLLNLMISKGVFI